VNPFVLVVSAILVSGYSYLGLRLIGTAELPSAVALMAWAALALPFLNLIWLPVVHWSKEEESGSFAEMSLQWGAFLSMGVLSFLLVLLLVRDLLHLLAGSAVLYGPTQSLGILALAFVLVGLGAILARGTPRVRRITIPIKNLPESLVGFTIAQISDLHVGPTIRRAFVEKVVERTNALDVDVVALTGDLVDGMVAQLGPHVEPLSRLTAREGRYYVTGNHEYYWGAPPWIREMERLGFQPLINAHAVVERGGARLVFAGVPDLWGGRYVPEHQSDPTRALAGAPADAAARILLAHQPRSAIAAAQAGFDLVLAGHTHGGQFVPWIWFVGLVQPFVAGRHRFGKMWVYVSRGTGYWGPPVRLGAPSEITLLTLTS
jgi:predicted MPP superfamily phosphohydrolase